ncbi:Cof-type HAD-IIB family hydrolase [Mycoplasmatota bacterium WC30]
MALIFIDLDGTALDRGQPAVGVIDSIKALRKNNHKVAIATGRSPRLLYGKEKLLGIDYLVLANGGYVVAKGDVIYERYIPNDVLKKTMDFVDNVKMDLVIEYLDTYVAYRKDTDLPDRFSDLFQIEAPSLDRTFYPDKNVFSMVVFKNERMAEMIEALPELDFNVTGAIGYDVNLKGGLKAEGVRELVKHLGYSEDEVYAIGDGFNDISMIKSVKYGIAMGNAVQELKDVADYVTTDVMDYGIRNALKHYKLI